MSYAPSIVSESALRHLYRPIVFLEPHRMVPPPSWLEHTPFAFWIVDALRPSTFVELGCQSGNSYASFAQAVQHLALPTACYAVDTWRGDPHAGFFDESVFEDWADYHERRFSTFSRLIRSTFDEALQHFSSGSIDLLHVDGYHTFEAVSHDFAAWRPKLSDAAVVLCHDINVRENDFGAWRLWERLRDEFPSFEFRHGHGLGVLGIGRDLPDPVRWLLSLSFGDPESANLVRLFFARIGAAVLGHYTAAEARGALQHEREARDAQLAQTTSQVESLRAQLSESERDTAGLLAEMNRLQGVRAMTDAMLATRTAEAERLAAEAASLHERVSALSRDVEGRDRSLARTSDGMARLGRQLEDADRRAARAEVRAVHLNDALRAATETVAIRTAEARDRASEADSHAAQLARLTRQRDASSRAQRMTYEAALRLDADATALLERLRHESEELHEQTARRKRLDSVLCWSQAQIAALGSRSASGRTETLAALKATARDVGGALRWARGRRGALAQLLRMAVGRRSLRDFAAIQASGLFDEDFYLARYPEVLAAGTPALVHFVLSGARAGYDPHPLFSTAFYAKQVPGLANSGQNPLLHYLRQGWRSGCSPHPDFDPAAYLAEHPDAARAGVDPFAHFLAFGSRPGTSSSSAERPRRASPPVRPGHERLAAARRVELSARSLAARDERPTVLVVSHVGPWRPRAGNEYRLERMLRWYQRQGYRVVPVIAPLPGAELTREGIEAIAAAHGNGIQVHRDGRVDYLLRDMPDVLGALDATVTPSFADLLGEDPDASPCEQALLRIDRTFCHDAVIATVLHLQRSLGPHILQVEYIWMTRLLPLVRKDVLKVVDTIDVFSNIRQKVAMFGVRDVDVDPVQESERLCRADLVIAIQDDERSVLTRLAPSVPVITAGVDFDLVPAGPASASRRILYIASDNPRNRKGLADFLRFAWPCILDRVAGAELQVVGGVARALDGRDVPGVAVVGPLDDLTSLYRDAALVVNPAVAGTGLKIKTLEALCHLRPVVTWPSGIEGLDPKLAALCVVARDWFEFSERAIETLTQPHGGFSAEHRAVVAEFVAPEHVYASVGSAYRTFFEQTASAREAHEGDRRLH